MMERRKTDIVVIGSGGAGMAAAVAAAEKGAKVTVLEKRKSIGGISITGMGIFAVESRLQKMKNHPLTKNEAFRFFMDCTHWRADAKLVSKYINRSASTIDWLEDMGVKFELLDIHWGQRAFDQTGHIVCTPEGLKLRGGVSNYMVQAMYERAVKLGVEVMVETEMTDLVKTDGRITKVMAKDAKGTEYEFDVKAAIVATGGYAHNPEMLMKFDGRTLNKDYFLMHNIPLDGEGIQLAWKAGAGSDGMCIMEAGYVGGINYKAYPDVKRIPHSMYLTNVVESPMLYVNMNGSRFVDESLFSKTYKANAIARQKDRTAYVILDSEGAKYLEEKGIADVGYMTRETNCLPGIERIIQENAALNTPDVIMADSLEELADKCGIPAEKLKQTVEGYNAACDKGCDEVFGKDRRWLLPVRGSKLYALRVRLEGYGTVGGIKINEFGEACTDNDDAILGLYAAGDCANNAVTWDFSLVFTLWGSTLSLAVNVGRFAGESAADYVKTV